MSRPKRRPSIYSSRDILAELKAGKTLKQLALADAGFPYASRLAMRMTECGSDEFYESRKKTRRKTNPVDNVEMMMGFEAVERWGLFERDPKTGRYRRDYLPGETEDKFKARVLQKIDVRLAVLWKLIDITRISGGPAPHSITEIAAEIGRSRRAVIECVKILVEDGYVVGFDRGSSRRSLWVRPDNWIVTYNLDERYDRIGEGERRDRRLRRRVTSPLETVECP